MYHNRLRASELRTLLASLAPDGLDVIDGQADPRALEELGTGFKLDGRFSANTPEDNATSDAWIIGR